MLFKKTVLAFAATLGLAACGDTIGEQALSGAVVGAGATAIFDSSAAGYGAAVGAVGGILYCQTGNRRCR